MPGSSRLHRRVLMSLDIETAPDPEAARLLAFARPSAKSHAAIHRIIAAAWLRASENEDGRWTIDAFGSCSDDAGEDGILASLDGQLRATASADGEISTYFGAHHDLPVIRRRAIRHWMFGADGIFPQTPIRHVDLIRHGEHSFRDWPKLREACAGLGIPCDPTSTDGDAIHPNARKAEVDTAATWLLRLHLLATERGSRNVLVEGWSALREHIRRVRPNAGHLRQFTLSSELDAALSIRAQRKAVAR